MSKKLDPVLKKLYFDAKLPGSFGGVEALRRNVPRVKRGDIRQWLAHQDTYTLHKPVRHRFSRRRIIVGGIDHQWQADLIDVQKLKKHNDGYTFLLTCIDVFSKYAWVVPLKNKTGASLTAAFEVIFNSDGRKPLKLQTDKGSEFTNRVFQHFLKKHQVGFFVTENEDIKAAIAERFNRTLKEKLWRYFTRSSTLRYVDVLPQIVNSYNHSYHRSIRRAPVEVRDENSEEVWQMLYGRQERKSQSKAQLKAGDRVRISKARRSFKKGYLPGWTQELFTVSRVLNTRPITYRIKDDHGEELKGTFYTEELQKVGETNVYKIEQILKTSRGPGGRKEYLIRWLGYPPSFDSWVPARDIQRHARQTRGRQRR